MSLLVYARRAWRLLDLRALRLSRGACSLCGRHPVARLGLGEHAVRCLRCGASPVSMSLGDVLLQQAPGIGGMTVYELSSRGPLFAFLKRRAGELVFSEYFDDVEPGGSRDGVPCQDVQDLTYADGSFDLCTSTDVFEHVPDDARAFSEVHRVLRPGGMAVFTVPLGPGGQTIERAVLRGGRVEHLLPPEFHDDHLRGTGRVLCYRNYGRDIVDRLKARGFNHAEIIGGDGSRWWGLARPVVLARRD